MSSLPSILHIIDPLNRTGKIDIPADMVVPTLGMQEYLASVGQRDYSLCLLFQSSNCNAGDRCHQIHVRPEYVAQLRQRSTGSTCCKRHGDGRSNESDYNRRMAAIPQLTILVPFGNQRQKYPLDQDLVARTLALEALLDRNTYVFPAANVCRLHQQERCRFGKDCKNIHICRDFYRMLAALPGVTGLDFKGLSAMPLVGAPMPASDSPRSGKPKGPHGSPLMAPVTVSVGFMPQGNQPPLQVRVGNPPPPTGPDVLSDLRTVHGPYAMAGVPGMSNGGAYASPQHLSHLDNAISVPFTQDLTGLGPNLSLTRPSDGPLGPHLGPMDSMLMQHVGPLDRALGPNMDHTAMTRQMMGDNGPQMRQGPIDSFQTTANPNMSSSGARGGQFGHHHNSGGEVQFVNHGEPSFNQHGQMYDESVAYGHPGHAPGGAPEASYPPMSGMQPQHRLGSIDATNTAHRASVGSLEPPPSNMSSRGSLDTAMYAFSGAFGAGPEDCLFPHGNTEGMVGNDDPGAPPKGKRLSVAGQIPGRPPILRNRTKEGVASKRPPPVLIAEDSHSPPDRPQFPPEPPAVVSPQMPTPSSRYSTTLSPANFQRFNGPPFPGAGPLSPDSLHGGMPQGTPVSISPNYPSSNSSSAEAGGPQQHQLFPNQAPPGHVPYPPGMHPMGGYYPGGPDFPMASTPTPMRKLKAFSHMWGDIPPSLPSPSQQPPRYPVHPNAMGPG